MVSLELIRKLLQEKVVDCYIPYSHFPVTAVIVTEDGEKVFGVNVENASFGLTSCAERNALFSFISQGKELATITGFYLYTPQPKLISPCGGCRQVMLELLPKTCSITLLNDQESQSFPIEAFLPFAFISTDLPEFSE